MRSLALVSILSLAAVSMAQAACCYFSAQNADVNQPAQKAFITWDPATKTESFTVQPKFEGNAVDFGMVIPTPGQPKLDEMPRDFFENLAVYTILMPLPEPIESPFELREKMRMMSSMPMMAMADGGGDVEESGVTVLESGVVGSLDYKIIVATDPEGLFQWLKDNKYSYSGDSETLKFYIDKKWFFTVMKIDTKQMTKTGDGSYRGDVTPTRFQFASEKLVYPLKITQISVPDRTEALFYVQAPEQMDLQGSWSWMYSYRVMYLTSGRVCLSQKVMTPEEQTELSERMAEIEKVRREIPGYDTTKLEWSRKLDDTDAKMLETPASSYAQYGRLDWPKDAREAKVEHMKTAFWNRHVKSLVGGKAPSDDQKGVLDQLDRYGSMKGLIALVPPPEGSTEVSFFFMPDRDSPAPQVEALTKLKGHLKPGMVLTKFRKIFTKDEMIKDLEIVPVPAEKMQEYFRILPQSPP